MDAVLQNKAYIYELFFFLAENTSSSHNYGAGTIETL